MCMQVWILFTASYVEYTHGTVTHDKISMLCISGWAANMSQTQTVREILQL